MGGKASRGRKISSSTTKKLTPAQPDTISGQLDELESEKAQLDARLRGLSMFDDLGPDMGTRELLDSMLSKCLSLFRCKSGSIFLFRPESEELELAVAAGPMREAILGTRQQIGAGIAGSVAESKEGIFVEDVAKSKTYARRTSKRYETNSFACVPLVYRGELLGVLSLTDKESGRPFDKTDVGRMLAVAGFSSGTIRQSLQQEKLRSFNIELHRRLDAAIERLQDTNQELAKLKNFNESILQSIVLGLLAFDDRLHVTFSNEPMRNIFRLGTPSDTDSDFQKLNINCDGLTWQDVLRAVVKEGKEIRCAAAEYTPACALQNTSPRRHGEHGEKECCPSPCSPCLCGESSIGNPQSAIRNPQSAIGNPKSEIVLNLSASPLRDARRKVTGGVIVVEDVTERVLFEKRLVASERHAVIGKLAARVAHELNNPLDGILRFINLSIAMKGEDDKTRDYLVECKKGLERMVGIVSSLLEFSRSTYPTQHDTRLNEVIREAVRTLRHRAEEQHIKVSLELQDGLPDLRCGELVQVFLNLTKNAYDAMKEGGEFKIATKLAGDRQVLATVSDTGCGMPPEIQSRIFDPFFTTKGPSEGTGLGLAICHDIIEKHGGKITVMSEPGKGTTFTITLPMQ